MRLDAIGPRTWLLATVAGWALIAWALARALSLIHISEPTRRS